MTAQELRTKYLKFFESKGHTIIPSASLVPENDPTTLFTGSGMQPMVPYLLGAKHPLGSRLTDSQKCFRTQDIEEVGDNRHTTVFEMLGNWSLGDYFKKEQISWMFEFLIKEIGLDPNRLYITVFRGNEDLNIPRDTDAVKFWQEEFAKVGIEAKDVDFSERDGMQDGRIFYYDEKKNWWSRAGVPASMPVGEPGGPDSEMFWDFGAELRLHENSEFKNEPCHVNCDCGRFVEIGNNVFMQYKKTEKGFEQLPKGNIDFGGGLERLAAAQKNTPDVFLTDLFEPIIKKLEEISGKKYSESDDIRRSFRVIADHIKGATFLISDGVIPSNTERGYFLRRLIRRAVRYGKLIDIEKEFIVGISEVVIQEYGDFFVELRKQREVIFEELRKEEQKFIKTLEKGIKMTRTISAAANILTTEHVADKLFELYTTFGFPLELAIEELKRQNISVNEDVIRLYDEKIKKHQELSRTASAGMFKGGLADADEITIKYHTATHLLLAALREILGPETYQKGSNITAERMRFDFNYSEKMSAEQLKQVEDLVNAKIAENIPVVLQEMSKDEALKIAKVSFDPAKYGDVVKVYSIGDFSIELCGGPHVKSTGELGHFKITKEEASSAGVRRIKAILE
ncbi:MAG TPA: alanine--tRNA ligase [Patescibacteria group bacterium]